MQEILDAKDPLFGAYTVLEHANPKHKDFVVVNWCLGNTCNYTCSYCPNGLHDGSVPWPELDTLIDFCRKVIKHYRGRTVYFEFTGGEVTLWKKLPELIAFLKSNDCRVGIISNGSRHQKFWSELVDQLDHVCLSFHPERGKADHFYDIVALCAPKIRTHVNLMMHPDHFATCLSLAYKVKDLPDISIAVQPLVVDFGEELFPYTEVQKKVIDTQNSFLAKQIRYQQPHESYRGAMSMKDPEGKTRAISPQRFISSGRNSWKGWTCYAGVEQIVVDMSGEIYRGWCRVGGAIGHIADPKLRLPKRPVDCDKDFCHCNLDIMTTKVKTPPSPWQKLRQYVDGALNA